MPDIRQDAVVVLHPFERYAKGEVVTDPVLIAAIRAGGQRSFVVDTRILVSSTDPAAKTTVNER